MGSATRTKRLFAETLRIFRLYFYDKGFVK